MVDTIPSSRRTPAVTGPPTRGSIHASTGWRPPISRLPAGFALILASALVAMADSYGYHRDELYFLRAGQQLALGYVDQPPLTPLLAAIAMKLFGDSLLGLRLWAALAAGLVVLLTGLIARELGGRRDAQALAAGAMAASTFLLGVGHVLSTATFDLLVWAALTLLLARALRGGGWTWLGAGAVAGVGLENKSLVLALLAAFGVGLALVGPRSVLRERWVWLGLLVALLIWAPHLAWQASHGWPAVRFAAVIADGGAGFALSRVFFLPYQLLVASPLLVPIWAAGLWRLARHPELRTYRVFAVAYLVLALTFLIVCGKPYYLAGMYPMLFAAGAEPTLRWVRSAATRSRARFWGGVLAGALTLALVTSAVLMLPVIPVRELSATPVAGNPNAAETIGWPELAETISKTYRDLPAGERTHAIALTGNYGEAGALDHFRDDLPLPPAYSGHNSYADWGPPPESSDTVIAVGIPETQLHQWFGSVTQVGRIDNGVGLANKEQNRPVWLCRGRLAPWSQIWPTVRHIS